MADSRRDDLRQAGLKRVRQSFSLYLPAAENRSQRSRLNLPLCGSWSSLKAGSDAGQAAAAAASPAHPRYITGVLGCFAVYACT